MIIGTFYSLALICSAKAGGKQRKMDKITDIINRVHSFTANTIDNGKKGLSKGKGCQCETNFYNDCIH